MHSVDILPPDLQPYDKPHSKLAAKSHNVITISKKWSLTSAIQFSREGSSPIRINFH